jgi:hypothetical protein
MVIRILKGLSGYRADGTPFRYSKGSVVDAPDDVAFSLIKAGQATTEMEDKSERPVAYAVTPTIKRGEAIHAVVKRGRKPKKDV